METRFVFLDTTEFISNSFNFGSKKLSSLRDKAQNGIISILTTDVVYREVVNRIGVHAKEGYSEVEKFLESNRLRTIRHLPPLNELSKIDAEILINTSIKQLDEFLQQANVKIIPTGEVKAERVLELYFGKFPPFGEGKKKSEFPDAISLVALENWCQDEKESVYVVSKDNDVDAKSAVIDSFIRLKDLGEFLEIVAEHEQEELAQFIHDFTHRFSSQIENDISGIFIESHELVSNDYDISAEFEDVKVENVKLISSYVIDADDYGLTLDIKVDVSFSANVSHQDYDTAAYDKEDDRYIFIDTVEYRFNSETTLEGTIEYKFDNPTPQDWYDVELESSSLEPELIEIDTDDIRHE